jgi:hypothetical protein
MIDAQAIRDAIALSAHVLSGIIAGAVGTLAAQRLSRHVQTRRS